MSSESKMVEDVPESTSTTSLCSSSTATTSSLSSSSSSSSSFLSSSQSPSADASIKQLWGGSFQALIPNRFLDLSDVRPVPNHQEIYSDSDYDQSIIFELNDMQRDLSDQQAVKFFWMEGSASQATSFTPVASGHILLETLPNLQGVVDSVSFFVGNQMISKGRETVDNEIQVYIALFRMEKFTTDFLITFNLPLAFAEGSMGYGRPIQNHEELMGLVQSVIMSLKMNNAAVFGQ